jgi:hypothetical protein
LRCPSLLAAALLIGACQNGDAGPGGAGEPAPAMLQALPESGFHARVLFTVGERIGDYQPPGILDGLGAWRLDEDTLRVLANHEFGSMKGYPYRLANGTELRGARVSYFDLDAGTLETRAAGLAFDRIRDRRGRPVTRSEQVSERADAPGGGLNALCSAAAYAAGEFGFVDDLFFTNEEVSAREDHPHGGSVWALDVAGRELWALPDLGRGSWENVAALVAPPGFVALLLGDDLQFGSAPLYLYVGRKDPAGDLLARNGLRGGRLHVWVADGDARSPADWRGTGGVRAGRFVPVPARDPRRAGERGHDALGYLDDTTLREAAWRVGAFRFSRPEDLHANPARGTQAVFASTGHGKVFAQDEWGTLYRIDARFDPVAESWPAVAATLTILHDGDDFGGRGIRSPDNLTWASDGMIYVQEDKATKRSRFAAGSTIDASVWRIDPQNPADYRRLAVIDRSVRVPSGVRDWKAVEFAAWESSGIVDISPQLGRGPDALVLLLTVQAHGLRGGPVGGREELVEGGQLLVLTRTVSGAAAGR